MKSILDDRFDPDVVDKKIEILGNPEVSMALLFSFLCPGLGQLVAHKSKHGIIMGLIMLAISGAIMGVVCSSMPPFRAVAVYFSMSILTCLELLINSNKYKKDYML